MIMECAKQYKNKYVCSVVLAVISVICGMLPYFAVAKMVTAMNYTDNIARVGTVMGQINDVLSSPEINRTDKNADMTGNTIEFRNVTFSYDSVSDALKNISLTIPEGKVTALYLNGTMGLPMTWDAVSLQG